MDNSNWLLEEFCKRVHDLKLAGMPEDEAKHVVKSLMCAAVDIMTGERSLVEVIKTMDEIKLSPK